MGAYLGRVFRPQSSLLQPERINPELNQKGYNVKSDVWSLGITMVLCGARACPWWSGGLGGAVPGALSFWGTHQIV